MLSARSAHKHSSAGLECSAKQLITMSSVSLFNYEQMRHLIKTLEQRVERGTGVLEKKVLQRTVQITVKISLWRCSWSPSLNNIERIATTTRQ